MRPLLLLVLAVSTLGCVGSTGSDLFAFEAAAAGPEDATLGQNYAFDNHRGYHVELTKASLHIGGVYLNRALPVSGAQATSCVLPGIYVAEVTHGRDVDLLNPSPQPFPSLGEATADHALAGEVWLTHGDVNAIDDSAAIFEVAGTATKSGKSYPFTGEISIGENRVVASSDPSQPGAHPICKERIVSPIRVDLTPHAGGSLLLRVDPKAIFVNVEFSELDGAFTDETSGQPNVNLYRGLQSREGVYDFAWR